MKNNKKEWTALRTATAGVTGKTETKILLLKLINIVYAVSTRP